MDKIYIHLFKSSPSIAVHQRKCDHCRCDHTALPGLHDLNIKIIQKKASEGPFQTEDQ